MRQAIDLLAYILYLVARLYFQLYVRFFRNKESALKQV